MNEMFEKNIPKCTYELWLKNNNLKIIVICPLNSYGLSYYQVLTLL